MATKNIVLIGFMGTGKSSVGKALAKKLGMKHVDIDATIEKKERQTISEIFGARGEACFRALEKEAILSASKLTGAVLTTGGGAVLDPENRAALKAGGIVICLAATPETIYRRVKDARHRPLLKGESVLDTIRKLLEERRPFYEQSDFTFQTDERTPSQVAASIAEVLKQKNLA